MNRGKKLERLPEVMKRTGKSRSSIYAEVKEGKFPAPISIGPRSVAWDADEIDAWIQEKIDLSRSTNSRDTTTAEGLA